MGKSKIAATTFSRTKGSQSTSGDNFYSPYGSSANGSYSSPLFNLYNPSIQAASDKINSYTGSLPTSMNVNDMFNNPFYAQTKALYDAPINRQYGQDQTALTDSLSAQNQLGSSYDALRNRYLSQDHDYSLMQSEGQARAASVNAYQQNINNSLAGIQGLGTSNASLLSQIYHPASYGNAIGGSQTFMNSRTRGNQSTVSTGQPQGNGAGAGSLIGTALGSFFGPPGAAAGGAIGAGAGSLVKTGGNG